MAELLPSKGGCWYCKQDAKDEALVFSSEWDSNVHLSCIMAKLAANPEDFEANVFARELDASLPTWRILAQSSKVGEMAAPNSTHDGILCPRCGADHPIVGYHDFNNDGDEIELECDSCRHTIAVLVCIDVSFRLSKIEEWSDGDSI